MLFLTAIIAILPTSRGALSEKQLQDAVNQCLAQSSKGQCRSGYLDTIDVSQVNDMSRLFSDKKQFNADISKWDVSSATKMMDMFCMAKSFNADISEWQVSRVTQMSSMFRGAKAFNADISKWQVLNVVDMEQMFEDATSFNADISKWDVSSVTAMGNMFKGATAFNADISKWSVSRVTDMIWMFYGAESFNADISKWDVSRVVLMAAMFRGATVFNADISKWCVSSVREMSQMFRGAKSFNADISKWDVSSVTKMNAMFFNAESFDRKLCGSAWFRSKATGKNEMFTGSSGSISKKDECKNTITGKCTTSPTSTTTTAPTSTTAMKTTKTSASTATMKATTTTASTTAMKTTKTTASTTAMKTTTTSASLRTAATTGTTTATPANTNTTKATTTATIKATTTAPTGVIIAAVVTIGTVVAAGTAVAAVAATGGTTAIGAALASLGAAITGTGAAITGTGAAVVATGTAVAGAGATAATTIGAGATAIGAGATTIGAGAGAAGAGAAGAGATATGIGASATEIVAAVTIGASATGAAVAAARLLAKYGLKPRSLRQTNILSPETAARRMISNEVLRVKDAPDMSLLEAVRHCTFLLSEENLQFVKGKQSQDLEKLKCDIEGFSQKLKDALAKYKSSHNEPQHVASEENCHENNDALHNVMPSTITANAAARMFQESSLHKGKNNGSDVKAIDKDDRDFLVGCAENCLAWAHDSARPIAPGAEGMTNDQAAAVMLYTQESCLYPRLNAALRNHDMRGLEPFLPYMKLLLSGLYHLPLTHVRTYRGVKLEIFETYNLLIGKVWSWWSFSSTTRDKDVLDTPLFLGNDGKRTLFCMNAAGVDIASFSAMPGEEEVLLLPGLPLVNFPGENPEPDLWTFEVETPGESVATGEDGAPPVMIDYIHPGWNAAFHDKSWNRLSNTHLPLPGDF